METPWVTDRGGAAADFGELPGVNGTVGFGLGFAVITDQPKTVPGSIGEYTWGRHRHNILD